MNVSLRFCLRWMLATMIVGISAADIFWEWRFDPNPVLPALSYQAVNASLGTDSQPAFWTYALWVIAALLCINALTLLVAWGLGKFYPERTSS